MLNILIYLHMTSAQLNTFTYDEHNQNTTCSTQYI